MSELSGVSLAKHADHDKLYLTFYNMQRLILMFIYHGIVCPDEDFPFADLAEYNQNQPKSKNVANNF